MVATDVVQVQQVQQEERPTLGARLMRAARAVAAARAQLVALEAELDTRPGPGAALARVYVREALERQGAAAASLADAGVYGASHLCDAPELGLPACTRVATVAVAGWWWDVCSECAARLAAKGEG
jgi:hypothetical protein